MPRVPHSADAFELEGCTSNVRSTGDTYQSSSNHDPDADSNGTTISVSRP
jgi:outer membrane lipoprotein SlyB